MHVVRVDAKMKPQQRAKPGGVQRRARPKNTAPRNAELGGKVRGQMSHNVHRIGDNEQDGIRRMGKDGRDNLPENVRIALKKLEARFTLPLGHAGGNHHHSRAREVRVVTALTVSGCANGTA